jgi:acyl-CoA synthetase (NDP forming)
MLAQRGTRGLVIYDGGFAERDEAGRKLQERVADLCREAGVALCGPNCMGILNPVARSTTYLAAARDPTGSPATSGWWLRAARSATACSPISAGSDSAW